LARKFVNEFDGRQFASSGALNAAAAAMVLMIVPVSSFVRLIASPPAATAERAVRRKVSAVFERASCVSMTASAAMHCPAATRGLIVRSKVTGLSSGVTVSLASVSK
jgi:hypothetical protein